MRVSAFVLFVVATSLSGCRGVSTTTSRRMLDHDIRARALRDAVVRGDLEGAKSAARAIAALTPSPALDASAQPLFEEMQREARRVAEAPDLVWAAHGVGNVAATCAACHDAMGRSPPPSRRAPTGAPNVETQMVRHLWASDRLWEGLSTPSEASWRAGAAVLADPTLAEAELLRGRPVPPPIEGLAATVRKLGLDAATTENRVARGALYGELLDSCARCHAFAGGGPR
jgi:cytochrome c553